MEDFQMLELAPYQQFKGRTISEDVIQLAARAFPGEEIPDRVLDHIEAESIFIFAKVEEPREMTASLTNRLFNVAKKRRNDPAPYCLQWNSNLGRIVCPRVCFSSDLMVWLAQSYDSKIRAFRDKKLNISFKIDPDTISNVFRLRPSIASAKHKDITKEANASTQCSFYNNWFKDGRYASEYPMSKYNFKPWVMDYIDLVNIALGTRNFNTVTPEVMYLVLTANREGSPVYRWEHEIAERIHSFMSELKEALKKKAERLPSFSYYSILVHLLIGQLSPDVIQALGGNYGAEFVQQRLFCIHEGEGSENRRIFYKNVLIQLYLKLTGEFPPRFPLSLDDFLFKEKVGAYFPCENYSFIRICGSKLPPKSLPAYAPYSIVCLEIIRQLIEDLKAKKIRRSGQLFFLKAPCRFGHYIYNSVQSMLQCINKMDEFCFLEIQWRGYDPLYAFKSQIDKLPRAFCVVHEMSFFEDALYLASRTGSSLENIWSSFTPRSRTKANEVNVGEYSQELVDVRENSVDKEALIVKTLLPDMMEDPLYEAAKQEEDEIILSLDEQGAVAPNTYQMFLEGADLPSTVEQEHRTAQLASPGTSSGQIIEKDQPTPPTSTKAVLPTKGKSIIKREKSSASSDTPQDGEMVVHKEHPMLRAITIGNKTTVLNTYQKRRYKKAGGFENLIRGVTIKPKDETSSPPHKKQKTGEEKHTMTLIRVDEVEQISQEQEKQLQAIMRGEIPVVASVETRKEKVNISPTVPTGAVKTDPITGLSRVDISQDPQQAILMSKQVEKLSLDKILQTNENLKMELEEVKRKLEDQQKEMEQRKQEALTEVTEASTQTKKESNFVDCSVLLKALKHNAIKRVSTNLHSAAQFLAEIGHVMVSMRTLEERVNKAYEKAEEFKPDYFFVKANYASVRHDPIANLEGNIFIVKDIMNEYEALINMEEVFRNWISKCRKLFIELHNKLDSIGYTEKEMAELPDFEQFILNLIESFECPKDDDEKMSLLIPNLALLVETIMELNKMALQTEGKLKSELMRQLDLIGAFSINEELWIKIRGNTDRWTEAKKILNKGKIIAGGLRDTKLPEEAIAKQGEQFGVPISIKAKGNKGELAQQSRTNTRGRTTGARPTNRAQRGGTNRGRGTPRKGGA